MWGESSKNCENNCQCSGLITDTFRINSGNGATKRKQEEAVTSNFKLRMNPSTLDFQSPNTPSKRRVLGEITNFSPLSSPLQRLVVEKKTPLLDRIMERKSPLLERNTLMSSPVTSRSFKRSTTKISRIFEERTRFKMSNKENEMVTETFVKLDMEEETRDAFGEFRCQQSVSNWSKTKLDFTDALQTSSYTEETAKTDFKVPEKEMDTDFDAEFETLHDLEQEFENDNFDECTKYEIISTDSPNIISSGRTTSRKISARNFTFGAPLEDNEQSTSFNKPNVNATRMLNFEDESFTFTSPAARKSNLTVKKSLKFNETPTKSQTPVKNSLRHEKSDSSIGSMSTLSPCSSNFRLFSSESTTSMESGFISELEEPFLELEESNSPKMPNFNDLLSGPIKENVLTERNFLRRPCMQRSLSFNPEPKARLNLFSIKDSPRQSQKRESNSEDSASKKRKSNCSSPLGSLVNLENMEKKDLEPKRPVLQRAFSENNASIMSALARSASEPDLIGDFSLPYALPLTGGDHTDLKSISCDILASLIRGGYTDSVDRYQIIDCRYPYEFEGGHIPGALNLYTPALVKDLLNEPLKKSDKRNILIFHCEFSLERGPKLYRYLRSTDRSKNAENYPNLNYPEIYLLHKGYRTFFQKYPELCCPTGYTAMLDPRHSTQLKKHRSIEVPTSFFTHHRKGHRFL